MSNDDETDNRFYKSHGRFPTIEEDIPLIVSSAPSIPPQNNKDQKGLLLMH